MSRIRQVLRNKPGPALVADGHFGTFAGKGHWSLNPPEGLDDLITTRVADYQMINRHDIETGANVLRTPWGEFPVTTPCQYLILEPRGDMQAIATIGDDVVGVRSADGRFTWFGISLCHTDSSPVSGQPSSDAPTGVIHPSVALGLVEEQGIEPVCRFEGDHLVAYRRRSPRGGSLVFLINLQRDKAKARITPRWSIRSAVDLLKGEELSLDECTFAVEVEFGDVTVIYCQDG